METVRVMSSCMVAPDEMEEITPKHRLWLSNLDLTVTRGHTPTFYVYRSNAGVPGGFSPEKLKASLARALVPFYPLAGRLVMGSGGRVEIDCNGEGVVFLEAESHSTIDDFGGFVPSPEIRQMLVPSVPSDELPCVLVMVQVTSFRCGGYVLGLAVHHAAVDGLAALHFVSCWAGITRGDDELLPPSIDRTPLRARSPPKVSFDHAEFLPPGARGGVPSAEAKPFSTTLLHVPKHGLAALKSAARARLTTFEAAVAHVWRCACVARGLAHDAETRLYMAADARTRLNPPLPRGFLGNAAFRTSVSARVGDVVSGPLERAAGRIREATARLGDEYVRSVLDFLELQGDLRRLAKGSWSPPATDIWAVSWLGLPVYDADFGWGRPVLMRRACQQFSGQMYVMHSPKEEGGISIVLSLETEHLAAFEKAFYHGLSIV